MIYQKIENKLGARLTPYALIVLSSLLTVLSFSPCNIWPLSLIAMLPLVLIFENQGHTFSVIKTLWLAYFYAILVDFMAFHWLIYTITIYGGVPWPAAVLIFFGYILITNLRFFLFFILLYFYFKHKNKIKSKFLSNPILNLAFFWVVSEVIGWQLFPWYGANLIAKDIFFIQIVDLIGVLGASAIWALTQFSLYFIFISKEKLAFSTSLRQFRVVAPLVLFILAHIYGIFTYVFHSKAELSYERKLIAVPQGHSPLGMQADQPYLSYDTFINKIMKTMFQLTTELINEAKQKNQTVDLVVWPESAIPFVRYSDYAPFKNRLHKFQENYQTEIIINDVDSVRVRNKRQKLNYSNMFLLDKDSVILRKYHKVLLLPFGEFMPLAEYFPSLQQLVPEVGSFSHGETFNLLPSKAGSVLPLICYEVILTDYAWSFYNKTDHKAQIMINITNDSWFGDSIESRQHLELGRLRSIELRLPMVRATNAGVSAYINTVGDVIDPSKLFAKDKKLYSIAVPKGSSTLFSHVGNIPLYCLVIIYSMFFIVVIIKPK